MIISDPYLEFDPGSNSPFPLLLFSHFQIYHYILTNEAIRVP